jgi:multidrug efflux pump subunit AcrA (membrane-fusion protein)
MKKSEAKKYIKELIVAELSVEEGTYVGAGAVAALQKDPKFAAAKDKNTALNTLKAGGSVTLENEEFEDEPTAKDIAANASIAKLQSKYTEVVKQMKSVLNQYKSAEGIEKQKYVDQLKGLTKLKKELEAMINPSMDDEDEI